MKPKIAIIILAVIVILSILFLIILFFTQKQRGNLLKTNIYFNSKSSQTESAKEERPYIREKLTPEQGEEKIIEAVNRLDSLKVKPADGIDSDITPEEEKQEIVDAVERLEALKTPGVVATSSSLNIENNATSPEKEKKILDAVKKLDAL